MARQTLYIATSESLSESEARFAQLVTSAWPDAKPRLSRLTFVQLMQELSRGSLGQRAVLLFVERGVPMATVDRVIEDLQASSTPAVILAEDTPRWRPMQSQGVIVQAWDSQPAPVAAMLFALAERQQLVDVLSRELAITQRAQAGVRAEVERMHEELHLAAGVQHEFTAAPLPRVDGLDMGVLYRPVNAVSGDIYSVRRLTEHMLAFFIADAVGHGVPAALLTMILTNTLITADQHHAEFRGTVEHATPAEVMERLNRRLVDGAMHTGRFATGVYGVFDVRTHQVTVSGGGHPAPMVVGRHGTRELSTEGPLLGVFPDAEFTQASTVLEAGETLLLYTDGLEAAFPRAVAKGAAPAHTQHVRDVMLRHDMEGASAALSHLELLLDEQAGSLHQADDITVLAIGRRGTALRMAA